MKLDFIYNGRSQGAVATTLLENGFNPAVLRPWIGADGRSFVALNEAGKLISVPVSNAVATLRKEEWKIIDEAVIAAAKDRLRIVQDLRSAGGLVYSIANGMSKTIFETQSMSDISEATISMDPVAKGENDRPEFDITSLPLPVIHKDFSFSARQIATSRNNGSGLDTTSVSLAARRVAEMAEQLVIGTLSHTYGGGTVYGLTNFPSRITTVSLTDPTDSGWTPKTLVAEVLAMRQASENHKHYGPWALYVSPGWDQYLDEDYSDAKGDNTVRQRLSAIDRIQGVRTADYLTGMQMVLVQLTGDVIRLVQGMDITTVQWESEGGMKVNFKVMAIIVPQVRADFNGNTGIVHAVAS